MNLNGDPLISVGRDAALECYITKSQGYKVVKETMISSLKTFRNKTSKTKSPV